MQKTATSGRKKCAAKEKRGEEQLPFGLSSLWAAISPEADFRLRRGTQKGAGLVVAQEIRCDPFRLETGQDGRAESGKGPEELLWGAAFILSN